MSNGLRAPDDLYFFSAKLPPTFLEITVEVIEEIRREIRKNGFLSATQILVRFQIDASMIRSLECGDIRRVEYSNSYVGPHKLKDLFYYAPRKKKHVNAKRKHPKPKSS